MSHPEADPTVGAAPLPEVAPAGRARFAGGGGIVPPSAVDAGRRDRVRPWIGDLDRDGGIRRADQRLAALEGRSSALFPQCRSSRGSSSGIHSRRPAMTPASWRDTPRAWSSPPRPRSPNWSSRRSAARVPSWLTSSTSCCAAAAYPWLIAARLLGSSACAAGPRRSPSLLALLYIWTDWPINYVTFGMLPYFLGIPLALVATAAFARFLERRTSATWIARDGR